MTREQAKQKLAENCKKANELDMHAVTFFITDMVTHDVYSSTGFFDTPFDALIWVKARIEKLDKYGVTYLCYEGSYMYEGGADFKFNEN